MVKIGAPNSLAGHSNPISVWREGDISNRQSTSCEDLIEGIGIERVFTDGPVFAAGDEKIILRAVSSTSAKSYERNSYGSSDCGIVVLAVVYCCRFRVRACVEDADCIIQSNCDQLRSVWGIAKKRGTGSVCTD